MPLDENLTAEIEQASANAAAEAAAVADGRDPDSADEVAGGDAGGDTDKNKAGGGADEAASAGDDIPGSDKRNVDGGDDQEVDAGAGDVPDGDGSDDDPAGDGSVDDPTHGKSGDAPAQLDDDLMARAIRQGLSPADARAFPDALALERVIDRLERLGGPVSGDRSGDPRGDDSQGKAGQDGGSDSEADVDPFANLPLLDREAYPDDVVDTIEAMTGALREQAKQIQEFRGEVAARREAEQAKAAQEVTQWFDGQIESLGDEFADALGAGGYDSGELTGRQVEARDRVAEKMAVLMQSYQSAGVKMPPREDVFQEAARLALPDVFTEIERKRLTGELRQRSRSHTSRASSKQTNKSPSPEEEAAAAIDRKFGGG